MSSVVAEQNNQVQRTTTGTTTSTISTTASTASQSKRYKSTSIFGGGLFGGDTPASSQSVPTPTAPVDSADKKSSSERHISQTDLEVAWRQASKEIAPLDRAISMRMESITPSLKSQTEIELAVGNQIVEDFFRTNKETILSHLKNHIGEGPLQMTYRIVDTGGPQKILSPYEQMQEMTKLNPALGKLKDMLGLVVG